MCNMKTHHQTTSDMATHHRDPATASNPNGGRDYASSYAPTAAAAAAVHRGKQAAIAHEAQTSDGAPLSLAAATAPKDEAGNEPQPPRYGTMVHDARHPRKKRSSRSPSRPGSDEKKWEVEKEGEAEKEAACDGSNSSGESLADR